MKYLLIFLCFTFVNGSAHLYAQNSGIIEYGIEYTGLMMDLSQLSEFQKTRQLQYSANAKRILKPDRSAFKVRFNEKGAVPELIPMMASDHGISMVDLILVSDEWIYLDGVKYHRNKNNGTIYFL